MLSLIARMFLLLGMVAACNNNPETTSKPETRPVKKQADTIQQKTKTILFFGNSLTAGYGVEPTEAFPALIQRRIDSLQLPYKVVNAGVSGETSSGGNSRVDWILKQPVDVFVLELGGNDGLRGIPIAETRKNLQSIIDKVRSRYPQSQIIIAGMQIPPNMGQRYTGEFRSIFPELATKNNAVLIPFLLEGVGGETTLNLEDGIHPTPEGHRILAENVWEKLEGLFE